MARLTISLPAALARDAARRAGDQKRSASAYVAILIEEDVRANVGPDAESKELIAKLSAILPDRPELKPAIEKLIQTDRRQRRNAA